MKRLLGLAGACIVGGLILVALLIGLNRQTAQARTPPPGCVIIDADITAPTTWALPACYRVVTGTVAIRAGAWLTVEPGVEIYFDRGSRLQINQGAGLTAVGTSSAPILFTSAITTGSEQRCDWEGILINSETGPSVRIQHAIIEYACTGIDPGGRRYLTLTDNLFVHNGDGTDGGAIVGDTDHSSISRNVIHSCQNGIILNEAGNNQLRDNSIYDIDQYGIAVLRGGVVGGADNQIESNTIHHCGSNGIRLEEGHRNTIRSNVVHHCGGAGIVIDEQSNPQLWYNQVFNNALDPTALAGILITNRSENVALHSNQILDNGSSGGGYVAALTIQAITDTFNQVVVNGNLISDTYGSGIYYAADNGNRLSIMQNNAICLVPDPHPPYFKLDNRRSGHTVDATYGWWGTNSPAPVVDVNGAVDIDPWITLQVTTVPTTVPAHFGATASVSVTLNDGAGHTVPDLNGARTVRLSASTGTINPPLVTLGGNGVATATFTLTGIPPTDQVVIRAEAFCNYATTTVLTVERTNVAIDKDTTLTQVILGNLLTYTIPYSNASNVSASDISITDTLPAGTRYASHTSDDPALSCVSGCVVGGTGPLVWRRLTDLLPNTRHVINLTLRAADATCGDSLVNHVTIGSATAETTLADNSASTDPLTVISPSVRIVKTSIPSRSKIGDDVTYLFQITNTSCPDSSPPLILGSISDTGTGWPGLGDLTTRARDSGCDLLSYGASCSFTVPYTIPASAPDPLTNTVTAHYQPDGFPTTPVIDDDDHTLELFQPSVQVIKTGDARSWAGDTVTYEFHIINTSSADSPDLVLNSVLDVGDGWPGLGNLTALALSSDCEPLAPGTSCSFTVTYTIPASAPDPLTNTVTISYRPLGFTNIITDDDDHTTMIDEARPFVHKSDHLAGDNLRTSLLNSSLTPHQQAAVLRSFQTAPESGPLAPTQEPPFVYEGDLITYSIGVFNFGTLTATNVVLTETLPPYTEYVRYGWTRVNSRTYTITVGTLPPDPTGVLGRFYQFVVRVVDPLPDDAYKVLENRVCVVSDDVVFDPGAHCGYEWTNVRRYPLRVTKRVDDDCVSPGKWFEYAITYQNRTTGTTFYDVVLTDTLDAYVSYAGDPVGEWSCTGQLCTQTIPSIPPEISGTLLLPVRLGRDFPYPARIAITNVVKIEYGNRFLLSTPIYTGPDLAVAKHGVVWHTFPDLHGVVAKPSRRVRQDDARRTQLLSDLDLLETLWTEQPQQPQQDSVGPGDWIVYRIVYMNRGLGPMPRTVLTETLPLHTSRFGGGWTHAGGRTYTLDLGDLDPGQGDEVEFIVQVDASLPPTVTWIYDYVTIGGADPECNRDNNWAEYYTPVSGTQPIPFTLQKEGPPVANNGDVITYTIVAVNTGPPVSGVTLSDPLPPQLLYVDCAYRRNADPSLDLDCNPDYPALSDILWQEDFDTGDRITTTLSARVQSDLTNSRVQNCATLDWSGGWRRACVDTIIIEGVNLVVIKDDNIGPSLPIQFAQPGELVTYTVSLVNAGTLTATNVVLTETLPLYTDYVGTGWTRVNSRTYTLTVGTLPADWGRVYRFVVRVQGPLPDGVDNLVNWVCGRSDEPDSYPDDNCNGDDTPVRQQPLWVEKSADPCITPGDEFNYNITYHNTTTDTVFANVVLTDTLDPYVHYVGRPGDGWSCTNQVCNLTISTIQAGGTGTLSLTVRLDETFPRTAFTNVVEIQEGNRFVLMTTIDTGADLSVVKNDNIGPLPLAQQARWNAIADILQLSPLNPLQATQHREYVRPGELVTYTILYVNRGLSTAMDVVLTERLPDYTSYIGGEWTHAGGQQYTLNVDDLAPDQGGEAHFVVQVDDPFPLAEDRVINLVEISGQTPECDLSNNQSADDTPVRVSVARGLWLTGRQSDNVIRVAPPTESGIGQVLDNIYLGGRQRPFGVTGDGQYLYVVNFGEYPENHAPSARGALSLLELDSGTHTRVTVGTRPSFVEAMDGCAYVTNYAWSDRGAGGVSVYCPSTDTAAATILPNVRGFFGIASDPSTNRIFAANRGFDRRDGCSGNHINDWCPGIYIIDGNTRQVIGFIPTVEQPYEIAYRSDPNQPPGWGRLYVIVPGELSGGGRSTLDEVWVYESRDSRFETQPAHQIQVGCQLINAVEWNGGEGIAIRGDHVYVSNYCDHTISVIHDPPILPIPITSADPSLPDGDLSLSVTSNSSATLELPHTVYLPLVARNYNAGVPRVVRIINLDNRGTVTLPHAWDTQALADCTGRCPKGIGFYGDSTYVSLFQSNDILRIDPQDRVTVLDIIPDGSITYANQVFGWEW